MAYPTPHTWVVGDPWPVTDANTFIRDALISVRRYQNSNAFQFFGTLTTLVTSSTIIGTSHFNLLSSTPDESYRMVVIANCRMDASGQPANSGTFTLFDQVGTNLAYTNTNCPAGGKDSGALVGGPVSPYSAGSNNGFSIYVQLDGGTTVTASYVATVFFAPVV